MRKSLAAIVLAAAVTLSACGSASQPTGSAKAAAPSPHFLSKLQQCQLLRADIVRNGGSPDRPTLTKIAGQPATSRLEADAQSASKHVGSSNQFMMPMYLAELSFDCRPTGVQIPRGS